MVMVVVMVMEVAQCYSSRKHAKGSVRTPDLESWTTSALPLLLPLPLLLLPAIHTAMLLSLRLWLGEKRYGILGSGAIRISPKRMVKLGCEPAEAEGLQFTAGNTPIPVPKVYRVHVVDGKQAIEMECIPDCQSLPASWRHFSEEQRRAVVSNVSDYIRQMRALRPKDERKIPSTAGGPLRVIRLGTVGVFGPFDDCEAFHDCVRCGLKPQALGEEVTRVHERQYQVKFTHGDLGVQNILIRDGKVAAIIDWEYSIAHYNHLYLPEFYERLVQALDDMYPEELAVERELWKRLDQPWDVTRRR